MDSNSIADRLAIVEVLHKYTRIIDRGEVGRLKEVFTEDGCFQVADLPSGDQSFSVDEFGDYLASTFAASNFMQHLVSNTLIDLNGDKASVESYLSVRSKSS